MTRINSNLPLVERIRLRVDKSSDGCWSWLGTKDKDGYGVITVKGVQKPAHRVIYELEVGDLVDGVCVCHFCDNPSCVRPDHLFLGTHKDNAVDKVRKGRHVTTNGEESVLAKLTEEQVAEIRRRYRRYGGANSGASLAREFGVHKTEISKIVLKKRWSRAV